MEAFVLPPKGGAEAKGDEVAPAPATEAAALDSGGSWG